MIKFLLVCVILSLALAVDLNDQTKQDIFTRPRCFEVISRGNGRCEWRIGLYRDIDYRLLNGRIIAYKILWSGSRWSEWYVPGINDFDRRNSVFPNRCGRFYRRFNAVRRMWSYFYDYTHRYIICRYEFGLTGLTGTGGNNSENNSENDD